VLLPFEMPTPELPRLRRLHLRLPASLRLRRLHLLPLELPRLQRLHLRLLASLRLQPGLQPRLPVLLRLRFELLRLEGLNWR
jgi:hypothetical protein